MKVSFIFVHVKMIPLKLNFSFRHKIGQNQTGGREKETCQQRSE